MITISGYSDDVVCIEGDDSDEIGAYEKEVSILIGTTSAGVVVRFEYAPKREPQNGIGDGGTWQARIDMVDEGVVPPWPVRVEFEGYSPRVVVDCPAGTKWRQLGGESEE